MRILLISSIILIFLIACQKDENEIVQFKLGTYQGIRYSKYENIELYRQDTIFIRFDSLKYSYSGSYTLDYGDGNYSFENDSIIFNDDNARIALYSWEWIINGKYKYMIKGDSLFLYRNQKTLDVNYKLIRIK